MEVLTIAEEPVLGTPIWTIRRTRQQFLTDVRPVIASFDPELDNDWAQQLESIETSPIVVEWCDELKALAERFGYSDDSPWPSSVRNYVHRLWCMRSRCERIAIHPKDGPVTTLTWDDEAGCYRVFEGSRFERYFIHPEMGIISVRLLPKTYEMENLITRTIWERERYRV